MVAPQDGDPIFVPDFESNEEGDGFDAMMSSINIVAHKEIIGIGYVSSNFEKFHEIVELAVDVAADDDGGSDRDNIGLFLEYFFGLRLGGIYFFAEGADFGFG